MGWNAQLSGIADFIELPILRTNCPARVEGCSMKDDGFAEIMLFDNQVKRLRYWRHGFPAQAEPREGPRFQRSRKTKPPARIRLREFIACAAMTMSELSKAGCSCSDKA